MTSPRWDGLDEAMVAALRRGDTAEYARLADLSDQEVAARRLRLALPEALYKAALWYAGNDIPVFPLEVGGKVPLPGSHGFKDASTSLAQVARWWLEDTGDYQDYEDYNIGLPTGILFDVIDIDEPVGFQSLADLREEGLSDTNVMGRVFTPHHHGMHIYIPATGDGNMARFMPGMDYRGLGGYVVAPPSVIPEGVYEWMTPLILNPTR